MPSEKAYKGFKVIAYHSIDDWLKLYSCLMVVAGLILAAFSAWKLSVITEIRSTMKPESKKIQGLILAL